MLSNTDRNINNSLKGFITMNIKIDYNLCNYSSYKNLENYVKEAEKEERKRRNKERLLDMIAGAGVLIMAYIFCITFLSL